MSQRLVPVLLSLVGALLVYPARAEKLEIEITEVPYREVYAFLSTYVETAPQETGMGVRVQSARDSDFQLDLITGLRRIDVQRSALSTAADRLHFVEGQIGGRYFPRRPTFGFGRTAVRVMAGAAGGVTFLDTLDFNMVLTAGLAFSRWDDPSGITLELIFRPMEQTATYFDNNANEHGIVIAPSWAIRVGFLFGPGR